MPMTVDVCSAIDAAFRAALYNDCRLDREKLTVAGDDMFLDYGSVLPALMQEVRRSMWSAATVAALMRFERFTLVVSPEKRTYVVTKVHDMWRCILCVPRTQNEAMATFPLFELQIAHRLAMAGIDPSVDRPVIKQKVFNTLDEWGDVIFASYRDDSVVVPLTHVVSTLPGKDMAFNKLDRVGLTLTTLAQSALDGDARADTCLRAIHAVPSPSVSSELGQDLAATIESVYPPVANDSETTDLVGNFRGMTRSQAFQIASAPGVSRFDQERHRTILSRQKPLALFMWSFNSPLLSLGMLQTALSGDDSVMRGDALLSSRYVRAAIGDTEIDRSSLNAGVLSRIEKQRTFPTSLQGLLDKLAQRGEVYTFARYRDEISGFFDRNAQQLSLTSGCRVYRGTQFLDPTLSSSAEGIFASKLPIHLRLDSNCSFTGDKRVANGPAFAKGVTLEVDVPKGFQGAVWIDEFTAYPGERELLVRAGSTIVINDVVCEMRPSGREVRMFGTLVNATGTNPRRRRVTRGGDMSEVAVLPEIKTDQATPQDLRDAVKSVASTCASLGATVDPDQREISETVESPDSRAKIPAVARKPGVWYGGDLDSISVLSAGAIFATLAASVIV